MKILIWLVCILVYSISTTLLRTQGITLGGIPTILLALLIVFLPAPALCRLWEKNHAAKDMKETTRYREKCKDGFICGTPFVREQERLDRELADGTIKQAEHDEKVAAIGVPLEPEAEEDQRGKESEPLERRYTCPKCGQLVREGEACDCEKAAVELAAQEHEKEQAKKKPMNNRLVIGLSVAVALAVGVAAYFAHQARQEYDRGWSEGYIVAKEMMGEQYAQQLASQYKETQKKISSLVAAADAYIFSLEENVSYEPSGNYESNYFRYELPRRLKEQAGKLKAVYQSEKDALQGDQDSSFSHYTEKNSLRLYVLDYIKENGSRTERMLAEKGIIFGFDESAKPSFASYAEWKKLHDADYISLSYDEWQVFTGSRSSGTASDFLRTKAEEQRAKIDREYGPTAYDSSCWALWSELENAGYTSVSFDEFSAILK